MIMMARRDFRIFCIACLTGALACGSTLAAQSEGAESPLEHFQRSIDDYMALRREVAGRLPPLEVTPTPLRLQQAVAALAAELRQRRAAAESGDIFTPDVRMVVVARLRRAFEVRDCAEAVHGQMNEDAHGQRLVVGATFSWKAATATPSCVLSVLPTLPDELQYRFVGSDLAIVDVDADLIVDVLMDVMHTVLG
jgi:hypothetical protein